MQMKSNKPFFKKNLNLLQYIPLYSPEIHFICNSNMTYDLIQKRTNKLKHFR